MVHFNLVIDFWKRGRGLNQRLHDLHFSKVFEMPTLPRISEKIDIGSYRVRVYDVCHCLGEGKIKVRCYEDLPDICGIILDNFGSWTISGNAFSYCKEKIGKLLHEMSAKRSFGINFLDPGQFQRLFTIEE